MSANLMSLARSGGKFLKLYGDRKMMKPLPYDAEVEYLESTGTQWIDTGIVCSIGIGVKVDIAVLELNDTTYPQLFGSFEPNNLISFGGWDNSSKEYSAGTSSNQVDVMVSSFPFVCETKINYMSDGVISITSGSQNEQGKFRYDNAANGMKFMLFAGGDLNGVTSYDGKCRISGCVVTDVENVKADFIPVRFTNEHGETEGAMFDRVSGQLFRNAGTGTFIIGPDKTI